MNLTRCEKGHFYDADKFETCPHCATAGMGEGATMPFVSAEDEVTEAITVANTTAEQNISLKDAVDIAVSAPRAFEDDDSKTVSFYKSSIGLEPVVGWMVCIEGSAFGDSFKLKSGRNFIGRSASMDINLTGDSSVSRDKHAIIIFEPKSKTFLAQAGESRELFYLNEEVVLTPVKINQYDILTIGNTRLMFFPCCSDKFNWDDYKKEK